MADITEVVKSGKYVIEECLGFSYEHDINTLSTKKGTEYNVAGRIGTFVHVKRIKRLVALVTSRLHLGKLLYFNEKRNVRE
jgi:hypothetical protein